MRDFRFCSFGSLAAKLAAFRKHIRGTTTLMFAGAMLPLLAMIGAAVDYTNATRTRTILQESLDGAVLAGAAALAQGKTQQEVTAAVNAHIQANFAGTQHLNPATTVTADTKTGVVKANVTLDVPMKLMPVLGINIMTINTTSQAAYGAGKIEMALVFDTTYSMVGAKLSAAQVAAKSLVDTLYSTPNAAKNVKIGLVPFTYYVNVGLPYRNQSWITGAQDYSTTTYECWDTYPNATYTNPVTVSATCYNDGVPYDCSYTNYTVNNGTPVKQCGNQTYTYTWNGCVGSRNSPLDLQDSVTSVNPVPALLNYSCPSALQRLTSDPSVVKAQIDGMTAMQDTYIAPGLLWGWRVLSPNGPFGDGQAYSPTATKVMVLLTDGANTHSPNYPDHEAGDVGTANQITAQTCANIKATGIVIYAIALQVTDPTIKSILSGCASGPDKYFDAGSIGSMQTAFATIGAKLNAVRLTN